MGWPGLAPQAGAATIPHAHHQGMQHGGDASMQGMQHGGDASMQGMQHGGDASMQGMQHGGDASMQGMQHGPDAPAPARGVARPNEPPRVGATADAGAAPQSPTGGHHHGP